MTESKAGGARSPPAESPLVVVVDDDPSVLRSLRSLLLSSGFRVQSFQSAAAFLASAEVTETRCLILDLRMPGMTGFDLVQSLRATHRLMPFVVLTAVADPQERERMMRNGAVACLRKPSSGPDLVKAIRTALTGA